MGTLYTQEPAVGCLGLLTSKSQHRTTGLGAGCFSFSGWPACSSPCGATAGCRGFKALYRYSMRSSSRNVPK